MSSQASQSESEQHHIFDYLRVVSVRWPVALVVFLLVAVSTGVITFLLPKQYMSTALIQVQEKADFQIFQSNQGEGNDPRFTTTQFEIIKSKEILNPVIEKLNLETRWAEKYDIKSKEVVYRKLLSMMTLEELRNTDLISISVLSPDKVEAADIANGLAEEYQQARLHEQEAWTSRSLSSLDQEVEKLRNKTEVLRRKASDIRVTKNINDLNPDSTEDAMQAPDKIMMSVEEEVSTQRLAVASLEAKYTQLSKLDDDAIMRTTGTLEVDDDTIKLVLPQFQEAKSEQAKLLQSGYGKNHPSVRAQTAKLDVYLQQLKSQIVSLREALKVQLEIQKQGLKSVEEKLTESRSEQSNARTNSASYYEAKNAYIQSQRVLDAAETRFRTEQMQRNIPINPAIIWERAEKADIPARPRVVLNILLGIVFGLILGLGVAFFIEYLDTSVKTMEDIEKYFELPVLAVIPRGIGVLMDLPPDAPDGEPYRILRTNVEFNRKDPTANVMTLVSGGPGEGKSTTLVNLAFAFAQAGMKTLIVDADLRRPRQHSIFKVSNSKGLTDYLSKGVPVDELIHQTKVENLQMIPSGKLPPGAIAMLNSNRMMTLIEELKTRYDMVLIDAPPILGISDSSVIVRAVDLTLIVIQHRRFPRSMLLRVKNGVINAGGTLLGAVLNNVDVRLDTYYQYQTNYTGYYANASQDDGEPKGKPVAKPGKVPPLVAPVAKSHSRDQY